MPGLPPEWLRVEARRLYGQDPAGYAAGRPDYPQRVYDVLVDRCGLRPGATVVEVGPGTGLVTRRLVGYGARVVAVEPDPAMAAHLTRAVPGHVPGDVPGDVPGHVEVVGDTFEAAALPEGGFDLLVAAMSFHWVDHATGLPKLGRVLRPGGWAAAWWTLFGDPQRPDPFRDATLPLLGEALGVEADAAGEPAFELDVDARRADLAGGAGLVDVHHELVRWTARFDPAGLRALYASMIRIRRCPPADRERLLDALEAVAAGDFGGVVDRPFVTALYTARRPGPRAPGWSGRPLVRQR